MKSLPIAWDCRASELLPESTIQETLNTLEVKYRRRLFDPFVTLWTFLSQVLDADKSCHNAVSRVISWLSGKNVELPSQDTGAYCQARKRLPEQLLQKLFSKVAQELHNQVTSEYLWYGRCLKVVDGSTISMPDTVENQKVYPQPSTQAPGCGFPIALHCCCVQPCHRCCHSSGYRCAKHT